MKILFYSHSFSPHVGGVETFSMRLALELPAALSAGSTGSFELTVVTQTPENGMKDPALKTIRVIRRPGAVGLWRLVKQSDVIMLAGPAILPIVFGLLRLKPVVVTHHGYQTTCPNGLLFHLPSQNCCPGHFRSRHYWECVRCCAKETGFSRAIVRILLTFPRRALCSFVQKNVCVSEHLSHRLQLPSSSVIRNGVPRRPIPELAGVSTADRPQFLFLGRMVAEKGINVLIEAAGVLKGRRRRFHLLLAGDGPERTTLEQLSRQLGLQDEVLFVGFKTGKELHDLLNEPSISVIPSIWEDVAPFAPLEQMMAAKAIIASDIGGLSEEVGDAGVTFPTGDPTALADRMEELILCPDLTASLGRAAHGRAVSKYSSEEMIRHYAELLGSFGKN